MSAFILEDEHIHVMIAAALEHSPSRQLYVHVPGEGDVVCDHSNRDRIGQRLRDANVRSVNARYSEDDLMFYEWRRPRHGVYAWPIPDLLSAIDCYEYQSCEFAEWEGCFAQRFCDMLRRTLIHKLPGYSGGPWAISEDTVPSIRD